jgi:hypothetical protein
MLPALRALPPELTWTLGGGTALALCLNHRISYDIDLFFESTAALRVLSPQRNPLVRALSDTWQEPGNYLKIECPDGDIDVLVAMTMTDAPPWTYLVGEDVIEVENPVEILAKKLHYRGSRFQSRDVFDALAILEWLPDAFTAAVQADRAASRRAIDRIGRIEERYVTDVLSAVNPTSRGAALFDRPASALVEALEAALGREVPSRPSPGG